MATRLEQTILKNLIQNEEFTRKTLPYIKSEFFQEREEEFLFKQIREYFLKYKSLPTPEALIIDIDELDGVDQQLVSDSMILIKDIKADNQSTPEDWLVDSTEKWCQDRAIYNAVMESISIIDGKHEKLTKNALPDLLQTALGVAFDTNVGHDYVENAEQRFEFYHTEEIHTVQ